MSTCNVIRHVALRQDKRTSKLDCPSYPHIEGSCGCRGRVYSILRNSTSSARWPTSIPRNPNTAAPKEGFSELHGLGFRVSVTYPIPSTFVQQERQAPSQRGAPSRESSGLPMSSANQCGAPERQKDWENQIE